jgi:NDP-sugar pyrophosphorylase family protein
MTMKAVLLAGGKGTRLLPYTAIFPKPLVPIGEIPVMELILRQLAHRGFREIIIAVGHLGHLIEAYFQNGDRFGVSIQYLRETSPLGTAGPVAAALPLLGEDEHFLVMNGDLVTTMDFSLLREDHLRQGADATVAVHQRTVASEFGVIDMDAAGRLTGYREKPSQTMILSMGCYVFRRAALEGQLHEGERLDMPDLILRLHAAKKEVFCHAPSCRWLDIGRPEDHQVAGEWFAAHRSEFLPEP